jgi:hypothetical protein
MTRVRQSKRSRTMTSHRTRSARCRPTNGPLRRWADEDWSHAGCGAATGAPAGGVLGGLGGWLVDIGALAIPGCPFIAAGALATARGGAAIGAGVGAIAGARVGMGVPKDEAAFYEGEVKSGRTLAAVRAVWLPGRPPAGLGERTASKPWDRFRETALDALRRRGCQRCGGIRRGCASVQCDR